MYKYKLTKGKYIVEGSKHIGYGIALKSNGTQCAVSFSDITLDRDKAARLVKLCNKLQLSPIHLKDVIDDFLICDLAE